MSNLDEDNYDISETYSSLSTAIDNSNPNRCLVIALHGKEIGAGDFTVEDILEAGFPNQIEKPLNSGEDKFIVFVSGLSVGSSSASPLHFQLFPDLITGHLGDEKEQGIGAQIVQVVIAGNSVDLPHGLLNGQGKEKPGDDLIRLSHRWLHGKLLQRGRGMLFVVRGCGEFPARIYAC